MIVVSQTGGATIPFDKFCFSANGGNIVAAKDIIATSSEIMQRDIATYKDYETAKKILKDMVTRYTMGAPVYYMPSQDEAEKLK